MRLLIDLNKEEQDEMDKNMPLGEMENAGEVRSSNPTMTKKKKE